MGVKTEKYSPKSSKNWLQNLLSPFIRLKEWIKAWQRDDDQGPENPMRHEWFL